MITHGREFVLYEYFAIDEFQILALLTYLKEIKAQNEFLIENKIIKLDNNGEVTKKYNDEKINEFIENLELKEIISKDEFILLKPKKSVITKIINLNENDNVDEESFYKNPNKFVMEIKINKIKFIIYKIYPDLTKANFLQLELNNLVFSKITSINDDSLMKIYFFIKQRARF